MSVSHLASALLAHIEERYPDGGYLISTPEFSKKRPPPPAPKVVKAPPPPKPTPPTPVERASLLNVKSKLAKMLPKERFHIVTPTPILLVHAGENTDLLLRLARALSKKKAPAQVVEASHLTPSLLTNPLVKLLIVTPLAKKGLSHFTTNGQVFEMESPDTYQINPSLRQPLWDTLCALI